MIIILWMRVFLQNDQKASHKCLSKNIIWLIKSKNWINLLKYSTVSSFLLQICLKAQVESSISWEVLFLDAQIEYSLIETSLIEIE